MFILEILLAVFFGTITYSICWATHNKPLGFMAKMLTVFISVLIVVQTVGPYVQTIKEKSDGVERKMQAVEKASEKIKKEGSWWQKFLYSQLVEPEIKK